MMGGTHSIKSFSSVSLFLVGGSVMEAVLLTLTSWGALVLPGLFVLVWTLVQPQVMVLGLLLFRPVLEYWRDLGVSLPGGGSLNLAAAVSMLVMASLVFNLFRTTVFKEFSTANKVIKDQLFVYWGFFLAYLLLVSLAFSPDQTRSLLEFFRLVTVPAIYWLSKRYIGFERRNPLLPLLMLFYSSLLPVMFGLHQFALGEGRMELGVTRVYSFFANPVVFSHYLSQVVIAGVVMVIFYYRIAARHWLWLIILCLAPALFAQAVTYGKGGWVGAAIGMMVLGMMYQGRRIRVRNILVPALTVVVLGLALMQLLPGVQDYVARLWLDSSSEESSLATRFAIWSTVWPAFKENPVLGYGLSAGVAMIEQSWGRGLQMHNDYLRLLIDGGIVGLGFFLWIYLLFFRHVWAAHQLLAQSDERTKAAVAASMALLAGYLVMSLVDNLFTSLLINYPMWIMGGVVRGYYERAVYEGETDKLTGNAIIELAPAETR